MTGDLVCWGGAWAPTRAYLLGHIHGSTLGSGEASASLPRATGQLPRRNPTSGPQRHGLLLPGGG